MGVKEVTNKLINEFENELVDIKSNIGLVDAGFTQEIFEDYQLKVDDMHCLLQGLENNFRAVKVQEQIEISDLQDERFVLRNEILGLNDDKKNLEIELKSLRLPMLDRETIEKEISEFKDEKKELIQVINSLQENKDVFLCEVDHKAEKRLKNAEEQIRDMSKIADRRHADIRIKIACDAKNRIDDEIGEIINLMAKWYYDRHRQFKSLDNAKASIDGDLESLLRNVLHRRRERYQNNHDSKNSWLKKLIKQIA